VEYTPLAARQAEPGRGRFLWRLSGSAGAGAALLRRPRFQELADALEEERNAFAHLLQSEDGLEGLLAFVEKRERAWRDA
jgi:enoyl-CoA hydratase/carnithine racemase